MPITYYTNNEVTSTSHIGCVIKTQRKEYRAMSDVYTDADYALVWLPEEQRTEWKRINILYMGCDSHGVIEVDIHDGEYAEDYEIFLFLEEEAEKARKKARQNREAKEGLKRVRKGRICRAIKGRKVPKGTEGKIFYVRGNRIGFKGNDGVAHWINDDQIEVMYRSWDYEPSDSWTDEWKRYVALDCHAKQASYANNQAPQSLKNPYAA
jgi:hypothetical protein